MTKRVVFFCASLGNGGAERVIFNLIRGLVERGINVDLLVADSTGELILSLPKEVTIVDLKARRVLTCIPGIIRHLRKVKPDVLFSALDYVNIVAIFSKYISRVSLRVVVSVHAQPEFFTGHPNSLRGIMLSKLFKIAHNKADKIVAVSSGLANELINLMGINKNKVCVIYNPIITTPILGNIVYFHDSSRSCEPPVILAVGRLAVEKDYPTLIRAFKLVRQHRHVRLQILGEGDQRNNLEILVNSLELTADVDFLGYQSDPYTYMKRASCFVLSSKSEGFGNVLVEALALGCPIVSTNCPYGPSEILDSGKWGALVPVGDYCSMADEIMKTLNMGHKVDAVMLRNHLNLFNASLITDIYINTLF